MLRTFPAPVGNDAPRASGAITEGMPAPAPFTPSQACVGRVRSLLRGWLGRRLGGADLAWLDAECAAVAGDAPARRLYMAFSGACRHTPRAPLALDDAERAAAADARPGWAPGTWSAAAAARTLLVLSRDSADRGRWLAEVHALFDHADLGEAVALHAALPVLPHPEAHVAACAEGVRSNMTDVFRAVAHGNPFPAERLPEAAWNQMVLKALFVEAGLAGVAHLDDRANPALARMLCDYAHERWAAGRPVSPELWRCVGPCADDAGVADLARAYDTARSAGDAATAASAAHALRRCPAPAARRALAERGLREDAT